MKPNKVVPLWSLNGGPRPRIDEPKIDRTTLVLALLIGAVVLLVGIVIYLPFVDAEFDKLHNAVSTLDKKVELHNPLLVDTRNVCEDAGDDHEAQLTGVLRLLSQCVQLQPDSDEPVLSYVSRINGFYIPKNVSCTFFFATESEDMSPWEFTAPTAGTLVWDDVVQLCGYTNAPTVAPSA